MVNLMEDMNLYSVKFNREDCPLLVTIPDLRKWLTQQYSLALFNEMNRIGIDKVDPCITKKKETFREIVDMTHFDSNAVYFYNLVVPYDERIVSIQNISSGEYLFETK